MISETMRVELLGKWFKGVIDNGACHLYGHTIPPTIDAERLAGALDKDLSPKDAVKALDEMIEELASFKERIADLGMLTKNAGLINRALMPEPEPVLIYDDVLAFKSNHAREVAIERFNTEHPESVLNVRGTEHYGQPLSPDGPWHYRVSGFITPRQKKTAVKAEEPAGAK